MSLKVFSIVNDLDTVTFQVFVYFIPASDNQSFSLEEMKNHFKIKTFNLI